MYVSFIPQICCNHLHVPFNQIFVTLLIIIAFAGIWTAFWKELPLCLNYFIYFFQGPLTFFIQIQGISVHDAITEVYPYSYLIRNKFHWFLLPFNWCFDKALFQHASTKQDNAMFPAVTLQLLHSIDLTGSVAFWLQSLAHLQKMFPRKESTWQIKHNALDWGCWDRAPHCSMLRYHFWTSFQLPIQPTQA